MTLNEYQRRAIRTRLACPYPVTYAVLGLAEEAGEVCGKLAKLVRDHDACLETVFQSEDKREAVTSIALELGDVLWMVANLADLAGISLQDLAQANLDKLARRNQAGTIHGSGDNR